MRLIITTDNIQHWTTKGEVFIYPKTAATINDVFILAAMFNLTPQHFANRVIFTEFYT